MVIYIIASVIVLLLVFYKFIFLRDPDKKIPSGNNLVSPADGRIVDIIEINADELKIKKGIIGKVNTLCSDVDKPGYLVSIFMSIFNVHVNRAPIAGEVLSIKHMEGTFVMAFDIEKSFNNERNEIIMDTDIGKIKIIQIAGFIARRIQCFVKEKQKVNKGEKIGRIVLGSQVSLILPKGIKLKVKVGDSVKVGETIIAEY